jgi:peptidoglycan/LPS O-acetylase OafA/YrhL
MIGIPANRWRNGIRPSPTGGVAWLRTPHWPRVKPSDGRSVGLDALRVLAAGLVVFAHTRIQLGWATLPLPVGGWNAGEPGVAIFFVLSGYLLWRPFVAGTPDRGRYLINRLARILPAYWLACLVLVPAIGGDLVRYLTFTQGDLNAVGVSWTLQAEMAFYIVLPFLAMLGRPLLVPILFGVASLGFEAAITANNQGGGIAERLIMVRFWQFAPGMILAAIAVRQTRAWLVVGIGILAVGAVLQPILPESFGQLRSVPVEVGATCLIAWGIYARPPLAGLWAAGAAISYAVYLWHADLLKLFGAWALALVVAVASASYLLLERPVLRFAKRWGTPRAAERPDEPLALVAIEGTGARLELTNP